MSRWTGVPVSRLWKVRCRSSSAWRSACTQRVVGQDEAVEAVAERHPPEPRTGSAGPEQADRLVSLPGPTGVGKTELARALAEFLFDDDRAMVRIDMGEYQEKHTVLGLVGAPPGYVGYEEGGQLSEAVRRRPYAVVLLDEIEKAHPDVFNVLLQVLEDGRLTDGQGRTVDFTNTVLIMTSNLPGDPSDFFRPEFVEPHRRDRPVPPAVTADLVTIVDIQLPALEKRMADQVAHPRGDPRGPGWLANAGYDPDFGAGRSACAPADRRGPVGPRSAGGQVHGGLQGHGRRGAQFVYASGALSGGVSGAATGSEGAAPGLVLR